MKIILFDPSLANNSGELSTNLGDIIIYESVDKYLKKVYPQGTILRVSSHARPSFNNLIDVKNAQYVFFGGSNALSSDLKKYNQWKLLVIPKILWPIYFPLKDLVLMGVGWWQYQEMPTLYTSSFYRKSLSHKYLHSVRDRYTQKKMIQMGFSNVVNTGCPTMWNLNGQDVSSRVGNAKSCLFTLTDYMRNPNADNMIIKILVESYDEHVFFFPQGSRDIEYISTLSYYQKYADRITITERSFDGFVSVLAKIDVDYIGTRLHAGIKALQMNKNTLILSVDNRAVEISKDTGLPVVSREDIEQIHHWIGGKKIFDKIRMPIKEIDRWLVQFNKSLA